MLLAVLNTNKLPNYQSYFKKKSLQEYITLSIKI